MNVRQFQGDIFYASRELSEEEIITHLSFPCMLFIKNSEGKIIKTIAYNVNGDRAGVDYGDSEADSSDEVITLGDIKTTTTTVKISLHSTGFNTIRLGQVLYSTDQKSDFTYTMVTGSNLKVLIVYALPTSQVLYLAEGEEGVEAIEPVLPEKAFVIRRIIASSTEVVIEPEINSKFLRSSTQAFTVREINVNSKTYLNVPSSNFANFRIRGSGNSIKIAGVTFTKYYDFLVDGLRVIITNETSFPITLVSPPNGPILAGKTVHFETPFYDTIINPGLSCELRYNPITDCFFVLKFTSSSLPNIVESGLILESDLSLPEKIKWVEKPTTSSVDRMLHYWNNSTKKWVNSVIEILTDGKAFFTNGLKSKFYHFSTDTTANIIGNATPDKISSDGRDIYHTTNFGTTEKLLKASNLELNIKTANFDPPTLHQLSNLEIKRGNFFARVVNGEEGQRSLFDGKQLTDWTVSISKYNSLSVDQRNAVKIFHIHDD